MSSPHAASLSSPADVRALISRVLGWVALALALVAFLKLMGWVPEINRMVPGSVIDIVAVAFGLATTKGVI
jgi:hypothetical protein